MTRHHIERTAAVAMLAAAAVCMTLAVSHKRPQTAPRADVPRTVPSAASRSAVRPSLPWLSVPPSLMATELSSAVPTHEVSARSVASPPAPSASAGEAGQAGYLALRHRIAWCESRNDPTAVNRSSGAAGAFQFTPGTWQSVTGLEPPASAYPIDVQRRAFDALYAMRGTRPWYSSRSCWSRP
jgi:hypothetical protein